MKNYITKILACLFISSTLFNGVYAKMNPKVIIETSKGNIEIELYQTEAPETVKNFINYALNKLLIRDHSLILYQIGFQSLYGPNRIVSSQYYNYHLV